MFFRKGEVCTKQKCLRGTAKEKRDVKFRKTVFLAVVAEVMAAIPAISKDGNIRLQ